MTREAIIEAAAKAIYLQRNGHGGTPWEDIHTQHREPYRKDVRAVMAVIEALPRVASIEITFPDALENIKINHSAALAEILTDVSKNNG